MSEQNKKPLTEIHKGPEKGSGLLLTLYKNSDFDKPKGDPIFFDKEHLSLCRIFSWMTAIFLEFLDISAGTGETD